MCRISWANGLAAFALAASAFAGEPRRVALDIPAMNCALCPVTVSLALRKLPGVLKVDAELATKSALVTYDPDRVSPEVLARAASDAGYPATPRKP
jgi:periplasmic mercuric ion binding protein